MIVQRLALKKDLKIHEDFVLSTGTMVDATRCANDYVIFLYLGWYAVDKGYFE